MLSALYYETVRTGDFPPVERLSSFALSEHLKLPRHIDRKTAHALGKGKKPGASVIVLAYNSARSIERCIESILPTLGLGDELIVVDNGSCDDTVEVVRRVFDDLAMSAGRVSRAGDQRRTMRPGVIENGKNLGFSAGCNVGMRASRGEYIILLNPDTSVRPGWLCGLTNRLADESIGAVGPVTDYVAGAQFVGGHLLPDDKFLTTDQLARRVRELHPDEILETKSLIGFCIGFRREVLNEVGLLDEDLFLGGEDLEISLRLRLNGYRLAVARDVFVHHSGGRSFASLGEERKRELLAQSTAALHRKLRALFAPGPVPCSMDLFGVGILPPDSHRETDTQDNEKETAHVA